MAIVNDPIQPQQPQAEFLILQAQSEQKALEMVARVVELTERIFGGPVEIRSSYIPGAPEEKLVVFAVRTTADVPEMLAMEDEWIRQVRAVAPNWHSIRLRMIPSA